MEMYIKNDRVYYKDYSDGKKEHLISIETINHNGNVIYRLNYHTSKKINVSHNIIYKMENMLFEHYHKIALKINEFIEQLPDNTLYKVNGISIEVVYPNGINEQYIDYDFYIYNTDNYTVGSGYYWKCRLNRNDNRIGRRKLYKSCKGFYFKESGFNNYIKNYSIKQ